MRAQLFFLLGLCIHLTFSNLCGQSLTHPGLLNTQEELDWTRAKIQQGEQPWKQAYDDIKNSSKLDYQPTPMQHISSQAKSDIWMRDCSKAYDFALLWYYSGDQRYADKAIEIMNAWTIAEKEHNQLNTQWAAGDLYAAAEIILHSDAGWKSSDVNTFRSWTRSYILPILLGRPEWKHNAQQTNIRALMMVYIFLDDRDGFNDELAEWRKYTPIYIRPDGTTNETCRDGHHVNYGIEGTFQTAQIAWNQGVDLFSEEKERLRNLMHLYSGWYTLDIPIPADICDNEGHGEAGLIACGGKPGTSVWHNPPCKTKNMLSRDKAETHLVNRLGMSLPYSRKYNDNIRASYDRMCLQDFTDGLIITSGENELPTVSFVAPTNFVVDEGYTELYVKAEANDPDGDAISLKLFINGVEIRQENIAPYEWGHAGTPDPDETLGLPVGDHEFKVLVTDSRGGVSESSFTLTVRESTLGINDFYTNNFTIHPNPSVGIFELSVNKKWKVYTLTGKKIMEGVGREIYLTGKKKGLYLLQIDKQFLKIMLH